PLHPNDEPDRFEAILFGDTQPRDVKEVNYIAHDVVEDVMGTDAAFGVTLGDIVFDDLDVFDPLNRVIAMIGIPWYNVIGNHDLNTDAAEDHHSDETFESIYGPAYYSFDYGAAHFIVVDDVSWSRPEGERGGYTGGLGEEQLEFIENDLEQIPADQLVVVFMHIPLIRGWHEPDRQALFRLLEARPLSFSISAHTHWQAHMFLDEEDGWRGEQPHHHLINVTVCGSWWRGEPDERGIPNALMTGGGPNGHAIIAFDGSRYSVRYQAAGAPEGYQMNIYAPDEILPEQVAETEILVNVFAGSERSTVEMRVDTGEWSALEMVLQPDPHYLQLKNLEEERGVTPGYRSLPATQDSLHLWRGMLPAGIEKGAHLVEVRTTDMFGQTYRSGRIIRVVDPSGTANASSGRRGRGGTDRR
ncbi:MAG: calcineurin-like phosphoesterase C-terminal domain-containing protein, partial [Acidobacteria bacterium]|nr:calcineurin-like phosphoesterase C-terminal domain-containing protein [Acidobacteriota bacterium]